MRTVIEALFRAIEVTLRAGNIITVREVILLGTCGVPAKSECLNFVQFNGRYGCPVYLTPGESTRTGPRSFVQTYPYVEEIIERTSPLCITYADEARPGAPVFGVKGETGLSQLMPDFVKGMAIDRMHALAGGVMKILLVLWTDQQYSQQPMSLVRHDEEINSRLISIKPQKFVHRMPRSIQDLIHSKASELKMFLFYYSIPVLEGLMDEEYFKHFLRLLVASVILSSDNITEMMIEVADDLIHRFPEGNVRDFCFKKRRQVKIIEQIADQTYSVGAYRVLLEVPQNILQLLLDYGIKVEQYKRWKYLRLLKKKKMVCVR